MTSATSSSPGDPTSWEWLQHELRSLVGRIRQSLQLTDPNATVVALDWKVWQLAAHMASLPGIYLRNAQDPESFVVPEDMDAFGLAELEALGTQDLSELSTILEDGLDHLLSYLGDDGNAPAQFYLMEHTSIGVGGVLLSELLLHHLDLATVSGEDVQVTSDLVRATLRGTIPASTMFTDRAVAERCEGVIHIHLRGGDDWTYTVANGSVNVARHRAERADLRINADPVSLVQVGFGRMNPVKAVLTGKILAWGRKPWLLIPFRKLFVEDLTKS